MRNVSSNLWGHKINSMLPFQYCLNSRSLRSKMLAAGIRRPFYGRRSLIIHLQDSWYNSQSKQQICLRWVRALEIRKLVGFYHFCKFIHDSNLLYAMLCTRPNLCFAVCLISRFQFKSSAKFSVSRHNFKIWMIEIRGCSQHHQVTLQLTLCIYPDFNCLKLGLSDLHFL